MLPTGISGFGAVGNGRIISKMVNSTEEYFISKNRRVWDGYRYDISIYGSHSAHTVHSYHLTFGGIGCFALHFTGIEGQVASPQNFQRAFRLSWLAGTGYGTSSRGTATDMRNVDGNGAPS